MMDWDSIRDSFRDSSRIPSNTTLDILSEITPGIHCGNRSGIFTGAPSGIHPVPSRVPAESFFGILPRISPGIFPDTWIPPDACQKLITNGTGYQTQGLPASSY